MIRVLNYTYMSVDNPESFKALNALNYQIAVIDVLGNIRFTNESWKSFSVQNNEVNFTKTCEGSNYFEACQNAIDAGAQEVESILEGLKSVIEGSKKRYIAEYPCHSPDEQRWFMIFADPISEPFSGLIVSHCNITDRKLKELEQLQNIKDLYEEARSANQGKSELLATVSHEFRSPLGVISGFTHLLLQMKHLGEKERDYIERIMTNTEHLKSLVDDILDFNKMKKGIFLLNKCDFNYLNEMESILKSFKKLAEDKSIHLFLTIKNNGNLLINSDPVRFRQILYNLISNALNFTNQGTVEVCVEEDVVSHENKFLNLKFFITDTGIGIPQELHKNIFEPFTNSKVTLPRKVPGNGIGLSISKKIAQALGGDIRLLKSSPQNGSEFLFELINVPFKN